MFHFVLFLTLKHNPENRYIKKQKLHPISFIRTVSSNCTQRRATKLTEPTRAVIMTYTISTSLHFAKNVVV